MTNNRVRVHEHLHTARNRFLITFVIEDIRLRLVEIMNTYTVDFGTLFDETISFDIKY